MEAAAAEWGRLDPPGAVHMPSFSSQYRCGAAVLEDDLALATSCCLLAIIASLWAVGL